MESPVRIQREIHRALSRRPPDNEAAIRWMERALAHPKANDVFEVPLLLGELADCNANSGRYDAAIAAMRRALDAGWNGEPDGRARIAGYMLRAGRRDEAAALYAEVKADTPDDIWLYNCAGQDYMAVNEYGQALDWLTKGLELALDTGDPEDLTNQLTELRGECLDKLAHEPDELQERARAFLAQPGSAVTRPALGHNVVTAVGWFPRDEFPQALTKWPGLAESWETQSYDEYCRMLQSAVLKMADTGLKPRLAPIRVTDLEDWCEEHERDAGSDAGRSGYAAALASRGQSLPWPPGRNEPCWCGSGRKYKRCCGTVPTE